jgi:hypothetical protein
MRFTLRDLLWLTVVAAVLTESFAQHRRQATQLRREARFQQWHYEQLADVLKIRTGAKTTVDRSGIHLRYPNGDTEYYPRPSK